MTIFLKILLILIISSCSAKISNFESYNKIYLSKSPFAPSKLELKKNKSKIIIFEFDDKKSDIAKNISLGNIAAKKVESIIAKNKLGDIIDRSNHKKLQKEITLAQINNDFSYQGPNQANYAVTGVITGASFNSKYISEKKIYNEKKKKYSYIPAKFEYRSKVIGKINIIELPSANIVKNISFIGRGYQEEDAASSSAIEFGAIKIGNKISEPKKYNDSIMIEATNQAIHLISEDIMNSFAPIGYIIEKRKYKDKFIFKINLGLNDGMKQNNKVKIFTKNNVKNELTKEVDIERKMIASARISNIINDNSSWIIIDNKENINKIRLGDQVKIYYHKSFLKRNNEKINTAKKVLKTGKEIAELFMK